jgi:hypothetical protein
MSSILLRTESASSSQIENLTAGARQLVQAELDKSSILKVHLELLSRQSSWDQHAEVYRNQLVWVVESCGSYQGNGKVT